MVENWQSKIIREGIATDSWQLQQRIGLIVAELAVRR
jgi:hypothetical protein